MGYFKQKVKVEFSRWRVHGKVFWVWGNFVYEVLLPENTMSAQDSNSAVGNKENPTLEWTDWREMAFGDLKCNGAEWQWSHGGDDRLPLHLWKNFSALV